MATTYLAQCASCETDATMKCGDCMNAPEYQFSESVDSVYCNRDCQKRHWSNHKIRCRVLRQRKKLLRIVNILKTALLTYKKVVYDMDLTKIEFQNEVFCFYQNQRLIIVRSKRDFFPSHLTTDIEHKEATLANNQCTTIMALLNCLTRKLLENETSSKIKTWKN